MNETFYNLSTLAAVVILIFSVSLPGQAGDISSGSQPYQEATPSVTQPTQAPLEPSQTSVENSRNAPVLLANPVINVWNEQALNFGQIGNPQSQVNILGKVSDSDGSVSSLTYRLNGGSSVSLRIGPDSYRLANQGDFNIALYTSALNNGTNTLVITATDNSGDITNKTVRFTYTAGRTWHHSYTTNWTAASAINEQAQVVDGLWQIVSGSVRTTEVGYDRIIAIGDKSWSHNYEVTVPITVHSFHPNPANPDDSGGVGVILRWQGHQGGGTLPSDWTSIGAYAYYSNRRDGLTLRLDESQPIVQPFSFSLNKTYLFKARVENDLASSGERVGRYSFKVWEQGQPEPGWDNPAFEDLVNVVDSVGDMTEGSMLLVAHRADATFGNVTITPIAALPELLTNKMYVPFAKR